MRDQNKKTQIIKKENIQAVENKSPNRYRRRGFITRDRNQIYNAINYINKGHYLTNFLEEKMKNISVLKCNYFLYQAMGQRPEIALLKKEEALKKVDFESQQMELFKIKETLFGYSENYYRDTYGFPLTKIPNEILESERFKSISVERAFNIFISLNLSPKDYPLFNLALLLDGFPLPPEVDQIYLDGVQYYLFNGFQLRNISKPSLIYVKKNLNFIKQNTNFMMDRVNKKVQYKFYDKVGRPFNINLFNAFDEWITNSQNRQFINFESSLHKKDKIDSLLDRKDMIEHIKKQHKKKMKEIMQKNYTTEKKEDFTTSNKLLPRY